MATINPLIVSLVLLLSIVPAHAEIFNIPSGDVTALIAAINAANSNGKKNRIILEKGTYTLTVVDNVGPCCAPAPGGGANGLPLISSVLTIQGAGAGFTSIVRHSERLGDRNAPSFRIFSVTAAGALTLDRVTIRGGGPSAGAGGGLYNAGTVAIMKSSIFGETSFSGGGIQNQGTMTITNSGVSGVSGLGSSGGGINNSGNLIISNSDIGGSVIDGAAGGISNVGTLLVSNSTISGFAGASGAIASGGGATLSLKNSTVAGSRAHHGGSAGISIFGGQATILNSTIADNESSPLDPRFAVGGIQVTSGTLTLQNTILARNSVLAPGPPGLPSTPSDCSGIINSLGNNLIGDPTGCIINLQPTDVTGDSGLDAFVDLGVPGTGHIPLMAGSPAIDAGNPDACPATDQLGLARVGNCDIGAIEFQPVPVLRAVVNVRPYSDNININPNGTELIRVAILGTSSFDTSIVDPATVRFGPNQVGAEGRSRFRDTNGDGLLDLVLRFPIQGAGIQCNDSFVSISGQTVTGEPIQGIDTIHVVGCN